MKMFLKCLAIVLILAAAPFVLMPVANAADTGDERVIPLSEFQCLQCNARFYTFAPDSLDPDDRRDNKEYSYQQANWRILGASKSQVPKCAKDPLREGAHIFDRNGNHNGTPSDVARHIREKRLVILRNGGGDIRARHSKWDCSMCGKNGFCFTGDDMDQGPPIDFNRKSDIFRLTDGSRLSECGWSGWGGSKHPFHPVKFLGHNMTFKSTDLQERLSEFWFSP